MAYTFEPSKADRVFAADYLNVFGARGRPFNLKRLGIVFYILGDCLYCGDAFQVLLPAHDEKLPLIFKESCHYLANEFNLAAQAALCLQKYPDIIDVDEAAPFYPPSSENLWHWAAESLPRVLALESVGYKGKYIVNTASPVVMQCMDMFGIAASRLLPGQGCYRIKNLMLPQRLSGFSLSELMPLAEFTRESIIRAVGCLEGDKRVYVKRVGRRKPVNEDEVLAALQDFGFETMVPETLSLAEQFRYMTNVACSVMAHGANSTLTWLQKPRSGVIEFFSNRYVSYNNLHAVRLLRLNYHALIEDMDVSRVPLGKMTFEEFMWGGYTADMLVDTMHMRILLESMLG